LCSRACCSSSAAALSSDRCSDCTARSGKSTVHAMSGIWRIKQSSAVLCAGS
jgi:hypothetical protein